jgi:formylmethanofuran--tetrahydromethanopterin N-formyltransferase
VVFLKVNNVEVENTFAEAFDMYIGRILITALNRRWSYLSTQEAKGLGVSATMGPGETGIESEVQVDATPDGRPGHILDVGHSNRKELDYWLIARIRKCVIPVPTTAAFNALPDNSTDYFVDIEGTPIQLFGDGFEEIVSKFGRELYKIPRMDGFFYIETKLGVCKGIAGGNFLILAESQPTALLAAEAAVDAMKSVSHIFNPCAGGVAASGTKVGGRKYKEAVATTNDAYNACIRDLVPETKLPDDVNCVYELFVNGIYLENIKEAMKLGIEAATSVDGVKKITAGNYGGSLGKIKIQLSDVLKS